MVVNLLIWEHRLETEAGSKLTQLGLMARCRQIRQQQSFAGINLQSDIAPTKCQRKTFLCTTSFFFWVVSKQFHCWSVGRQGLKRMRCTSINTAICRSKTLHLQNFVHVFLVSELKTVKSCKAAPSANNSIMFLGAFFQQTREQDQQPQSHTCVWKYTFENTCSWVGTAQQFIHK